MVAADKHVQREKRLDALADELLSRDRAEASPLLSLVADPFTEKELTEASISPMCIVRDYLYADVSLLNAAGGTGKTTTLIFEAVHIALGRPLWGLEIVTSGATLFATAEDSRQVFAGRLREIMAAMELSAAERKVVLSRVRVLDLVGTDARLVYADRGTIHVGGLTDRIVEAYRDNPPAVVVFDPLVSFGASEEAVNSNAQALIGAARRIVRGLRCCVRLVHHTGQEAARNKTMDAYAGRGGSALADGARMVAVMAPWSADAPGTHRPPFGFHAKDGEAVILLARPKLSYTKPGLPLIWIRRRGYTYEHHTEIKIPKAQARRAEADQVEAFLVAQLKEERYYTARQLDAVYADIGLTRVSGRTALNELVVSGRIVDVDLPEKMRRGRRKTYLCPRSIAPADVGAKDDKSSESSPETALECASQLNAPPLRERKDGAIKSAHSFSPSLACTGELRRNAAQCGAIGAFVRFTASRRFRDGCRRRDEMTADEFLSNLRAQGFTVALAAEGCILVSPRSRLTEDQCAAIRDYKAELLALLHQEHIDEVAEYVNERAAVLEYDHQLSRPAAEREAVRRAVTRFQLVDDQGGGTAVGECPIEELLADLKQRYGGRLAACEVQP